MMTQIPRLGDVVCFDRLTPNRKYYRVDSVCWDLKKDNCDQHVTIHIDPQ